MAGIQLSGLVSGMDTASIIDGLMKVEKLPRNKITLDQDATTKRQTLLQEISSKLTSLKFANDETTIAGLKDRIAKTIDYLKSVKASEVDGTEAKEIKITFPSGQSRDFTGQSLLLGNSLPNFYFHATTAYDIIRQCGVEVGKRDFMGSPPA